MSLDLSSFENAIERLREGIACYESDTSEALIRDGVIHRFKVTYEIAHKTLKRYLESASPTPEQYDLMAFQDLIRSGNEQGLLLGDWPRWRGYRDMRARTSHTYDEEVALQVVAGIPGFLAEAVHLCERIARRPAGSGADPRAVADRQRDSAYACPALAGVGVRLARDRSRQALLGP